MTKLDSITRAFAITDLSLREFFPGDFYKRCMYASFGMAALLNDDGMRAQAVGGDFLCAVVSDDGQQMSLQGFGTNDGGEPSHFWLQAGGNLLDLGPMYLPYESSFSAPSPPLLRWSLSSRLPGFLAYRERVKYAEGVDIATPEIRQRNADFISACRANRELHGEDIRPPQWQLKDMQSLRYAAQRQDPWALAACKFVRRSIKAEFPAG
jgi:hypothetical protein